ncbi:MAG TPA: oxygen-dependent coproporphyrinogen oxidase [Blastocatellia bacterium]|nr:oxygen-dependent coproporphyrinogen oxidase [Blastocatellia bacterium]
MHNVPLRQRSRDFFVELQDEICAALERLDGQARFREDVWQRDEGGGGLTRVMEGGAVFEKAGVNFSEVYGSFDQAFAGRLPVGEGTEFFATGISLVLHPLNPFVPTVHANFRYLERGSTGWFGGGSDLTPYYPYLEDAIHFHQTLKQACDRFDQTYYPRFKKWCDEYFFIKHRDETRGVGGIFFDYLTGKGEDVAGESKAPAAGSGDLEGVFEFVQAAGRAFLPAYLPIAERRGTQPYGDREREFQLIRRGRYVEFNLVYDRGTHFGLETRGRTESILMSLPPLVRWVYDYKPEPGSREAQAQEFFRPCDWLNVAIP